MSYYHSNNSNSLLFKSKSRIIRLLILLPVCLLLVSKNNDDIPFCTAFTFYKSTSSFSTTSTYYRQQRSRTLLFSVKEANSDNAYATNNNDPLFEDVDGIGGLTINNDDISSTNPVNNEINELIVNTSLDKDLIDPATVVEAVFGSATNDSNSDLLIIQGTATTLDDDLTLASVNIDHEGEDDEENIEVPNLRKIVKFAIPAIGVWLCSPLLSLIDTSSVGLLSGTTQQAALNPAVAVTDYGALLVAFMYTATTNLVAGARGKERLSDEKPKTKKTLINALQMSGYVGAVLGSALIMLGPVFLRAIIGNDGIDPEVFAAALRYVRVRALGMPAAVIIGSAQSACLGLQDIKSPMYVLIAAAVVNFLGDIIFVPQASAWVGGAAGAAWATVFSQYAALAMFFKWMTGKPKKKDEPINLTKAILELTGKSDEGKPRRKKFRRALQKFTISSKNDEKSEVTIATSKPEKDFSVRGFLAGKEKELLSSPTVEEAKVFWPYFLPVTTTQFGRVSAYISMIHVVSSALGTLSLAANQVILSVFYCLTPIADSLNLTAQSFVPSIAQKKESLSRARAMKETTVNFIKSGLLFSVGMVTAVNFIPFVSKFFTQDLAVIALVNSIVPVLSAVFATHGVLCALEGKVMMWNGFLPHKSLKLNRF